MKNSVSMIKMMKTIMSTLTLVLIATIACAENDMYWDKTYPLSDKVIHEKVEFHNRFGIYISADMFKPKDFDASKDYAALIVGTPYGGVKEQGAGIYAQAMAERGFVTIAFDESYNGESGGFPRQISSVEGFVEDFHAAVDYMGTRPYVNREKIGIIGICGSGGFSLSAAQVDPRIKAVATVSMYDMSRVKANGWKDSWTEEERNAYLEQLGEQRWKEYAGAETKTLGLPETIDEDTDPITREFYGYYKTDRGHHPRSTTHFTMTSDMAFMNYKLLDRIESISPRPILFIMGENAHSRYFTEDAYEAAAEPKELVVVPGANHVDLYDRVDLIPWDKLDGFFTKALK
ncbi:alpha/beta hydrolase [Desulfovibrio oxyclinae]|uniref:alpha/beta hydrolase n=1 Tax=Desulfovibrio oxyclinae TaxID=63560 RepID=UPI00037BD67B|nr:alpha/beta hydrolase [Desulfovibrio oxyclinae]